MKLKHIIIHFTREEAAEELEKALRSFEVKSVYLMTKDEWIKDDILWCLYPLSSFRGKLSLWFKLAFRKLVDRYTSVLHAYGFDRETKIDYNLTCYFYRPFRPVLWDGSGYNMVYVCLLYTSPSPRDLSTSRMPSSA